MRKCPSCRSSDVRESATPTGEETWRDAVLSRYRCRACRQQFFGPGRTTYRVVRKVVGAIAIASVAVLLFSLFMVPDMKARRSSIDAVSSTT